MAPVRKLLVYQRVCDKQTSYMTSFDGSWAVEPWFKSQMWSYVELPACWKLQATRVGDDVLMILTNSTVAWAIAAINMERYDKHRW